MCTLHHVYSLVICLETANFANLPVPTVPYVSVLTSSKMPDVHPVLHFFLSALATWPIWGHYLLSHHIWELVWIPSWLEVHSRHLLIHGAHQQRQHGIHGLYYRLHSQTCSRVSVLCTGRSAWVLPKLERVLEPALELLRRHIISWEAKFDALQRFHDAGWPCHEASRTVHWGHRWGCHRQWCLAKIEIRRKTTKHKFVSVLYIYKIFIIYIYNILYNI